MKNKLIIHMKLQNPQLHTGFCRIIYKSRNHKNELLTYCLQEDWGGVKFYRCSKDGEPDYEIKLTKTFVKFERTQGNSSLEIAVNKWIDEYENSFKEK